MAVCSVRTISSLFFDFSSLALFRHSLRVRLFCTFIYLVHSTCVAYRWCLIFFCNSHALVISLVLSFTRNYHAVFISVNASTLFENFIHRILGVGIFIYIICLPLKWVQIDWKVCERDATSKLDGERGEEVAFSMPAANNVKCGNASLFCGVLFKLKMRHIHSYARMHFSFVTKTSGVEICFPLHFVGLFYSKNLERRTTNIWSSFCLKVGAETEPQWLRK